MNFVARVEEHLRDLGSEARRKHPGVKEASERAILALRQLQNQYATAVRRSSSDPSVPHPTTSLFRSQDILRPFLLAANYPDASFRLLTIALDSMDLLIRGEAICPGDAVHVARVVAIQGNVCASALLSSSGKGGSGGQESAAVFAVASTMAGLTGLAGSLAAGVGRSVGYGSLSGVVGDDSYSSSAGMTGSHSHRLPKEDERIAHRLLETLTMIAEARGLDLTEEVLGQCLAVCLMLVSVGGPPGVNDESAAGYGRPRSMVKGSDGSDSVQSIHGGLGYVGGVAGVRRAAATALKKIVDAVFERAAEASRPPNPTAAQLATEGNAASGENGNIERDDSCTPIDGAVNYVSLARTVQGPALLAAFQHDAKHAGALRTVALRCFTDLCALAEPQHRQFGASHPPLQTQGGRPKSSSSGGVPPGVSGPFAQALAGGVHHRVAPPSRSVCLELLDAVLRKRADLFGEVNSDDGTGYFGINETEFREAFKSRACPLAASALMVDSSTVDRSSSVEADTPANFAMHFRSIKLASTIVGVYGGADDLTDECRILFACLVRAVTSAAEAYRDTDGFEDGYVYTSLEREITCPSSLASATRVGGSAKGQRVTVGNPVTTGRSSQTYGSQHGSVQHAQSQRTKQRPPPRESVAVSAPTLWRAALSLESLYALIEGRFETLVWLHSSASSMNHRDGGDEEFNQARVDSYRQRSGHGTILAQMAEAISDFATVGASCRDSILGVVDAASISLSSHGSARRKGSIDDTTSSAPDSCADANGDTFVENFGTLYHETIHCRIADRARNAVWDDWGSLALAASEVKRDDGNVQEQSQRSSIRSQDPAGAQYAVIRASVVGSPADIESEAIWIGYNCVLSISHALLRLSMAVRQSFSSEDVNDRAFRKNNFDKAIVKSLVDSAFAPSLALFQHFLKRFPACSILTSRTLVGYTNLSCASLPLRDPSIPTVRDDMHRRAILSSLCKLSLPRWGKNDGTCLLCDHHVSALAALFRIVHLNSERIGSEWAVVLSTWEQLSSLGISSVRLSTGAYKDALRLSECLGRLSSFTTSLSTETFVLVLKGLVEVSNESVGGEVNTGPRAEFATEEREQTEASLFEPDSKVSLGGKLMRAITGGGAEGGMQRDLDAYSNDMGLSSESPQCNLSLSYAKSTRTYGEEFLSSVYDKLVSSTKPTTRKDVFRKLPFSLVALTDMALSNSFRFDETCGAIIEHLCELAAHSRSGDVRAFSMDTLSNLITLRISGDLFESMASTRSIAAANPVSIEDILLVTYQPDSNSDYEGVSTELQKERGQLPGPDSNKSTSQAELLLPLCKTIIATDQHDTAEAGLNAIHVILEGAGHNISGDSWPLLINAISALSGHSATLVGEIWNSGIVPSIDRSGPDWATVSTIAFRCLKIIIDDFLDELPSSPSPNYGPTRAALLDCCASFGSSRHDVNTSLTATGMLWTLADQDPTPSSLNRVLEKLARLSSDDRAEVRNCSVNTLFSCVVGLGENLTAEQWKGCLCGTIFEVMESVATCGERRDSGSGSDSKTKEARNRYKVSVHHSRDSVEKQRATTQTLTLRGLERVLRQFFHRLLATATAVYNFSSINEQTGESPWFEVVWSRILSYAYGCATITTGGRDTLALRTAGVDLLALCAQLACKAGIGAAATPAKVGTNMQVVNGALRSVKPSSPEYSANEPGEQLSKDNSTCRIEKHSAETEVLREQLFTSAFEHIERFCSDLEKGQLQDEDGSSRFAYVESSLLQVLTKLAQGLAKLYECCKNDEMCPLPYGMNTTDLKFEYDMERRMVNMVTLVARNSCSDSGSRFLTQSQRACLELFKYMSNSGSLAAFQALACLGGRVYFMRYSSSSEEGREGDTCESLEYESAKLVADSFSCGGVSKHAKLIVLCSVLDQFEDFFSSGCQRSGVSPNFVLLVPIVKGGMEAASLLEREDCGAVSEASKTLLDKAWEGMIETLSGLVSPVDSANMQGFSSLMKSSLEIASSAISNIPEQYHGKLGAALANCSSDVVNTMKLFAASHFSTAGESAISQQECCLRVFVVCFNGLCQCDPYAETLRALSEKFLRNAVDSSVNQSPKSTLDSDDVDNFDVEVEVALVVCSAIKSLVPPNGLVLPLFSWLCRLTGSSNSARLRKEAGELLGTIDVVNMVQQAEDAESRAKEAEFRNTRLQAQVESLEIENQELRRQVAMFTESSALK